MSAWLNQFKVGDQVEFELALRPDSAFGSPHPRWNGAVDYGSSGVFVTGTVSVLSYSLFVDSDAISTGSWYFSDLKGDFRPGYVQLKKAVSSVIRAPEFKSKYVYEVTLPVCAKNKKTGVVETMPESVMKALLDQGERGARRAVREWPRNPITGNDKVLKHKVESDKIAWWFE